MKQLLFTPDDVLFFRDGRPMQGASAGYGARLPEPHVLNGALHAACHRAFAHDQSAGHIHRRRNRPRFGQQRSEQRTERFGALTCAGPFPVIQAGDGCSQWLFPCPADLQRPSTQPALLPVDPAKFPGQPSLQGLWPVANRYAPSKDPKPEWLTEEAYAAYLNGDSDNRGFVATASLFAAEYTVGIGIDPASGTTGDGRIFTKAQLRLRDNCQLGAYGELPHSHEPNKPDLLAKLFPADGRICLGGELRTCTVQASEPAAGLRLPRGPRINGTRVKWVLLSPAIFPYLPADRRAGKATHAGGWLPSWVEFRNGEYQVQLLDGPGAAKAKRLKVPVGQPIRARLVAACIGRPIPVTGWTNVFDDAEEFRYNQTGARSTLLAVPAGSIYYFEAADRDQAQRLADALNWHGAIADGAQPDRIVNRRSTLMGEKGYGLGVCGSWQAFSK